MNGRPVMLHVLLVEDEAIVAMTTQDMLGELGHECRVCTTLGEAELALAEDRFDFALLDVNVNGAAIFPIAERLRAAGTPFLFTTGYGGERLAPGFEQVPVLAKPYQLFDLRLAIAALAG